MAAVYCMSFTSIYSQIPGIWGKDGISPAHIFLDNIQEQIQSAEKSGLFSLFPTIYWYSDVINEYLVQFSKDISEFHAVDNVLH
jgi:hypothetical protein